MAETVASLLRGLSQVDLATYAPEDPNDPFAAAYPTFGRYRPPGAATYRDEVVLLRRSIATVPTADPLGAMPGGLAAIDEANDVPAVFRALNPINDASDRGFPTFTYGQKRIGAQIRRYMNVIRIKRGFQIAVAPDTTPAMGDPTAVVAMFRGAHFFARSRGFVAGFPTFNRIPVPTASALGNEVVVFPSGSPGVVVTGDAAAAGAVAPPSWRFESVPMLHDEPKYGFRGGFALATTDDNQPLFFNVFDDELFQYRRSSTSSLVKIDWDATKPHYPIRGQVSAATDQNTVHVLYPSDGALWHATRPMGQPASFTYVTASGRTSPSPTGSVGRWNRLTIDPATGTLHALAELSVAPGSRVFSDDLVHVSFDGTTWTQRTVDGAGQGSGHVAGRTGIDPVIAIEPQAQGGSTPHAFYALSVQDGYRLRHAEFTGRPSRAWFAETLDGSGPSAFGPPLSFPGTQAKPGAGPTRASVGADPTAVYFDGSLWCIYDDRTWGNLRVARGTRDPATPAGPRPWRWEFHVLDGSGRRGRASAAVQSAVAVVWNQTLSVFYIDQDRSVIRHAYRPAGASWWRYEVLDGSGGPDGRVSAPIREPIAVAASGGTDAVEAGQGTTPLYVAYIWQSQATPRWSNVRLATLA